MKNVEENDRESHKVKILIRGGSIAYGYSVNRNYVDHLRDRLPGVEIINNSRYRDTSFQGVWTFDEDIDAYNHDALILHFGVDDAYHPVYRSEFRENLVTIIRKARKNHGSQILLLTSHPFERPYDMNDVSIYYRAIREIAGDLQCGMIPVHLYWIGAIEEKGSKLSEYLQVDQRYPNEEGHRLYADAIEIGIRRIIEDFNRRRKRIDVGNN